MSQNGETHFKNLPKTLLFIILAKITTPFNGFYTSFKLLKIPSTSMTKVSLLGRVVVLAQLFLREMGINLALPFCSRGVREDVRPHGFSNGNFSGGLNRQS